MSFVLWDVDVNTGELAAELKRKRLATSVLAPTFAIIAEDLVAAVQDRIDSKGDGQWDPLKQATIDRKGSELPLQDTEVLMNSMRPTYGDDWAMASTSVGYVVYHLDGGPVIPKRNPFELQPAIFEEASRMLAEAVAGA